MKLNAEQQRAVDCNDKKILCLACAGAGKTQVLISRLWRLVSQENIDPRDILCLTFTRAAAFEMRERYSKLQKADNSSDISRFKPEISTFHAFCYSLILHDTEVRTKLGYFKPPKILTPEEVKKYEKQAVLQCNIKLPQKKLKHNAERTKSEELEYKLYAKAYNRLLKSDNFITFDILCHGVCRLFYRKDESILKYLSKYKHILIDEFQDTDSTQVKFLESFENASWFCVGDALQNLYSFRGTSNEFVKQYSQDDEWTKIRMNRNYRSTKQICEFANINSTYASGEYRIELVTDKEGVPVKTLPTYESLDHKLPFSVDAIQKLVATIVPERQTAILCRTNAEVSYVTHCLSELGISYTTDKKDATIENILKSSISDRYLMDWLSTYLSSEQYANYIRLKTIEEKPDVHWFINTFGQIYWIRKHLEVITQIRHHVIDAISKRCTIPEMIEKVVEILDLQIEDNTDYSQLNYHEAIEALIEKIYEAKISEVYVGTVHSVKGLEFEDVIILGVKGSHFRLTNEDNQNVYYVAITRAKEHLTVIQMEEDYNVE